MAATQYIAFLRAVNIGGRTVRMTELKRAVEALGFDEVSTFIASGNVIFRSRGSATLERRLERGLQQAFGFPVPTMVRSTAEVAAVAAHEAFTPLQLGRASLYVGFIKAAPPATAVKKLLALQTDVDELRLHGREVYWLARKNIAEATITGAAVEKALQLPVTFRNIHTVRRLAAKYPC